MRARYSKFSGRLLAQIVDSRTTWLSISTLRAENTSTLLAFSLTLPLHFSTFTENFLFQPLRKTLPTTKKNASNH